MPKKKPPKALRKKKQRDKQRKHQGLLLATGQCDAQLIDTIIKWTPTRVLAGIIVEYTNLRGTPYMFLHHGLTFCVFF
jgi:hypothetical protein